MNDANLTRRLRRLSHAARRASGLPAYEYWNRKRAAVIRVFAKHRPLTAYEAACLKQVDDAARTPA